MTPLQRQLLGPSRFPPANNQKQEKETKTYDQIASPKADDPASELEPQKRPPLRKAESEISQELGTFTQTGKAGRKYAALTVAPWSTSSADRQPSRISSLNKGAQLRSYGDTVLDLRPPLTPSQSRVHWRLFRPEGTDFDLNRRTSKRQQPRRNNRGEKSQANLSATNSKKRPKLTGQGQQFTRGLVLLFWTEVSNFTLGIRLPLGKRLMPAKA